MLTVSEYSDLSALASIRDLWRELWWKTPRASFFQSVEWFERQCRRAADVQQPRVFVIAAAGRPVGLVPWVEKCASGRIGRLRVLSDSLADQGFSCGPLGPRPEFTLKAALDYARADSRWDRLELRHVELGSDDRKRESLRFDSSETPGSSETLGTVEESRALVECRGDWVWYLRSLPADVREEYQRSERALAGRGRLEHVRYRPEGAPLDDDDPRWELFGELEQAQSAWAAQSERRRSLREMHETAAAIAGVDLNLLRLNDKPIAWAYNYRCDGRIEIQRSRAVGEFSSAAASVLLGRMLCDGFRRGDESYLFDRQTSRTAGGWQTGQATSRRIHFSRRRPWTRLIHSLTGFPRKNPAC